MGYRSDVAIALAVPAKDAERLWAAYRTEDLTLAHLLDQEWTIQTSSEDVNVSVFMFSDTGVKWYEGYGDVKGILNLIDLADTLDIPYAHKGIVIGENHNDTEVVESMSEHDEALHLSTIVDDALYLRRDFEINI